MPVLKSRRFTVSLPRSVEAQEAHDKPGKTVRATAPAKSRRMLVVDDNVDAAHMLAMLLEATGHKTMVEHTAKSALERARRDLPTCACWTRTT